MHREGKFMEKIIIKGAAVFDGTADSTFNATVVVEDERITQVLKEGTVAEDGAEVIDGTGMTLMPGMVEGHAHPSFVGIDTNADLGAIGPEEHTLRTAGNLKLLLSYGFTSIFEAASAKPMIGVKVRDAINSGLIVGPRMLAGSPEITTTGGLGDERMRHIYQESFGLIADGPVEMRRVARECVRDGVDVLKINISGDEFVANARAEITPLEDDELAEIVGVAKKFGKVTAAHARSSASVKMAVKHGIDCIYHCDFADEEAIDLLESVKDKVILGPAVGLVYNGTHDAIPREVAESMGLFRKFEHTCATYHELRKRGMRVVVGGDYGFNITPMGQNARDIEHFVNFFGYAPTEALACATSVGAELMDMKGEIGEVKEGYLADLLLVRGDVTQNVSLLQDRENLALIMKGGEIYKRPEDKGVDLGRGVIR